MSPWQRQRSYPGGAACAGGAGRSYLHHEAQLQILRLRSASPPSASARRKPARSAIRSASGRAAAGPRPIVRRRAAARMASISRSASTTCASIMRPTTISTACRDSEVTDFQKDAMTGPPAHLEGRRQFLGTRHQGRRPGLPGSRFAGFQAQDPHGLFADARPPGARASRSRSAAGPCGRSSANRSTPCICRSRQPRTRSSPASRSW